MNYPLSTFTEGLIYGGPASEHSVALHLYGQFVGDWITETRDFQLDGTVETTEWDLRFAWVLEGRAIQDLWITPPRSRGPQGWHEPGIRYGTTLRIYDAAINAWHILWINPPSGTILRQLGRQVGEDIVQLGETNVAGELARWVFRDITANSFRWCNEHSLDGGQSWRLVQEMRARRR